MEPTKPNPIISVDSETGLYWYGERILWTSAMIEAAIEQVKAQKHEHRA